MFRNRINQLRKRLLKEKLDGVLISSVYNITYLTGYANFLKEERAAYLLIGNDFEYIITDGRYSEAIKKEVPFQLFERSHNTSVEKLFKELKNIIKVLGIEEDDLTISEHKILNKHFKKIKHFDVGCLRTVKSKKEISKIEKACKIGDLAFAYILKKIKNGATEKEIAHELENFIRGKGAATSFPIIAAFGKNSAVPHHQTGNAVLGPGQIILLDFGVKFENYCSDMTRTVFFGKPDNRQKKIYKTVLEAQQKAVDFINSRIETNKKLMAVEVDKVARDYIVSQGYPLVPHSLGHGIGLEFHERPSLSPKSKEILKPGMVFSIEPGIYLPGAGGVRIEDLFVLEKEQLRQITNAPKKITSVNI